MTGLECQHLFCVSCWDQYLRVMVITEGKGEVSDLEWIDYTCMKIMFFQFISCPSPHCNIAADETFVL